MSSLDTEFHRRLSKKIEEEVASEMSHLKSGVLEFDNYKSTCGSIRAYEAVMAWCSEIEQAISEGK